MAEFWITEQVAEHLNIDVADVYRTRRNGEWPGKVGRQRGRRLLFASDLIESGPTEPETTENPTEAILWALEGIHATLRLILREISKLNHPTYTTTGEEE